MSLGKRLRDIENVASFQELPSGSVMKLLTGEYFHVFHIRRTVEQYSLKVLLALNQARRHSTLFILDASIIEGLDLHDASETLTRRPTFKIHYAALHKNLLAIHALYFGRIYTYDEKADAFHTWHLERIERGWSLLTMSEEIKPDWIVLDECDCYSRHLPGVYKIARFTDPVWWKGSVYEAKDQRRQSQYKAAYYRQQQRETSEQGQGHSDDAKAYSGARAKSYRQGPEGYTWYEESFDEWFQGFKQRAYQEAYGSPPPTLDSKPGSILWAYSILGLERGQCSFDDVKRARKELMKRYHPDATNGDSDLNKAQEINWAADVLERVLA